MTSDLNATYVTHKSRLTDEPVDVWTVRDEHKLLTVVPGMTPPPLAELGHHVHTPCKDGESDCPYHATNSTMGLEKLSVIASQICFVKYTLEVQKPHHPHFTFKG